MDNKLKQFYKNLETRTDGTKPSVVLSAESRQRVKTAIFANLGSQLTEQPEGLWAKLGKIFLKGYILAPLIILIFITGTTMVSASAVPGDTLYPIKRQVENARLLIAPNENARLELQINFAQKRLEEVEKIGGAQTSSNTQEQTDEREKSNSRDASNDYTRNDEMNDSTKQRHRQTKAREQANQALEFLDQAKKNLHQKGKEDKVMEIEARVKKFRDDQNRTHFKERGEVKDEVRTEDHNNQVDLNLNDRVNIDR